MDSPVIDDTQTRAICDEIGERLRMLLRLPMPEDRADLDDRLDQLADSEAKHLREKSDFVNPINADSTVHP